MNNLVLAPQTGLVESQPAYVGRVPARVMPIQQITATLYRQRYLLGLIILAALLIGALITWTAPRLYTASAAVQLDQQIPQVIAEEGLDPEPNVHDSDRFLQTQIDRVGSRSLAEAVATKHRLGANPAHLAALGIEDAAPGERREQVIQALQANVLTELGLNTRLAHISFTSRDPQFSADMANAYADALIESNLQTKADTSTKAEQYLMGELREAKKRLEGSERRMLAYARQADLTTTVVAQNAADQGGSLRAQQLGALSDSLAQATARRIDAEQRWSQVQGSSAMSLPEVQENRAIQDLVAQRAVAQAALQEERQRHTDNYPTVQEAAAKIAELNGQIAGVAGNIQSSFRGRYIAAAQQERQLSGKVAQMQGAAMAERERSVGYNSLKREVETNNAFYDGLLQRYKQVAAAAGAPAANVRLVDEAAPPLEPSSPDVARNMALAGMSGLILALLVGSVRERTHHVIRSAEDVEQNVNLPTLGVVPWISPAKLSRNALVDPRSVQSEAYHSIAVGLQQMGPAALPRTLLITSSMAAEGKSTSALGLARSLAQMGKKVLLIDGDLRHPSLADSLGQADGPGLSDALAGSVKPAMVVRHVEGQGFNVVVSGETNESSVSLLSAGNLDALLDEFTADHDIVIIDGPPIMGLADAIMLAGSVDAVLVVVEANRVHFAQLDLAVSRLPATTVVGGVVTKFDAKRAGVHYGNTEYYNY